ncbi:hypothetical protein J6S88_04350 [bacterium]|nr:hypothetical protein [bacterium]
MRNKLFLTVLLSAFAIPAFAYISTSDTYSSDFLKTNGYSDTLINIATHEHDKAVGIKSDYPNKKVIKNKILRALYNAYVYIDPAIEADFLEHNIDMEPSFYDL